VWWQCVDTGQAIKPAQVTTENMKTHTKVEQFDIDMTIALVRAGLQASGTKGKDVALATIESLFIDKEQDAEELFWDVVQMMVERFGVKPSKPSKAALVAMAELGTLERGAVKTFARN